MSKPLIYRPKREGLVFYDVSGSREAHMAPIWLPGGSGWLPGAENEPAEGAKRLSGGALGSP